LSRCIGIGEVDLINECKNVSNTCYALQINVFGVYHATFYPVLPVSDQLDSLMDIENQEVKAWLEQ